MVFVRRWWHVTTDREFLTCGASRRNSWKVLLPVPGILAMFADSGESSLVTLDAYATVALLVVGYLPPAMLWSDLAISLVHAVFYSAHILTREKLLLDEDVDTPDMIEPWSYQVLSIFAMASAGVHSVALAGFSACVAAVSYFLHYGWTLEQIMACIYVFAAGAFAERRLAQLVSERHGDFSYKALTLDSDRQDSYLDFGPTQQTMMEPFSNDGLIGIDSRGLPESCEGSVRHCEESNPSSQASLADLVFSHLLPQADLPASCSSSNAVKPLQEKVPSRLEPVYEPSDVECAQNRVPSRLQHVVEPSEVECTQNRVPSQPQHVLEPSEVQTVPVKTSSRREPAFEPNDVRARPRPRFTAFQVQAPGAATHEAPVFMERLSFAGLSETCYSHDTMSQPSTARSFERQGDILQGLTLPAVAEDSEISGFDEVPLHPPVSPPAGDVLVLRGIKMHGFRCPELNVLFIESKDPSTKVNGRETYWTEAGDYFLYRSKATDTWGIAKARRFEAVINGNSNGVAHSPEGCEIWESSSSRAKRAPWREWDCEARKWITRPSSGVESRGRVRPKARFSDVAIQTELATQDQGSQTDPRPILKGHGFVEGAPEPAPEGGTPDL